MQLVLIVDDDVVGRANLARSLNKLPSIEAIEASTVREALVLAGALDVDLVVTELRLPDATALELLPHLEREGRRLPVIVATRHGADRDAARVPAGIEVRVKPVPPMALRELVARTLGCANALPPFSLVDYLQLAGFGRHSLVIEVSRDGAPLGAIAIVEGTPWHAIDHDGEGRDALFRLLAHALVDLVCLPIAGTPARNLEGSSESLLLEAARVLDELRAKRPAAVVADVADGVPRAPLRDLETPRSVRIPMLPAPHVARGTRRQRVEPGELAALDFDALYARGIDALLGKRYADARAAFARAREIRSTPTIEANLERLAALGFA